MFKVLKGKNLQSISLYHARIPFKIDGEIKIYSDDIVQETGIKTIPMEKKCKKAKGL